MKIVQMFIREEEPQKFTKCAKKNCTNNTSFQKPFCEDHIEKLPYVQKLKSELADLDNIDAPYSHASDLKITLQTLGPQTFKRMAKHIFVNKKKVQEIVTQLEARGQVKQFRDKKRLCIPTIHLV